jgi:glutaredoxin-related protein
MSEFDLMYEIINNLLNGCNTKTDCENVMTIITELQLTYASVNIIKQIQKKKWWLKSRMR